MRRIPQHLSGKIGALIVALALLAGLSGAAIAVVVNPGTMGGFEDDGNLVLDAGFPGDKDWSNVSPVVAMDETAPDDGFQGSSKENDPGDWVCQDKDGGITPAKDDILRAYINPRLSASEAYLDLAYVRAKATGDTHINFEFNKNAAPVPAGGSCKITRASGDLLITYDYPGGDDPANIRAWTWTGSAWSELTLNSNDAKAATNAATVADPIAGGTIEQRNFGEVSINLLADGLKGFVGCPGFGWANIRSRSSGESFSSALQDRFAPVPVDLNTCGKIIVKKIDDRLPSGLPVQGAVFGLFKNAAATGTPFATAVTGADGKATFDNLEPGIDFWVKEISVPGNHTLDPHIEGPIKLGFRETKEVGHVFVNPIIRLAKIKIDPQEDANQVGDDHDLKVTLTYKGADETDFVPANNTLVTLSKVSGPGDFKGGINTCTTNASGQCTVTIVSSGVGLTTVKAEADVMVDTKPVHVETNATAGNSGPADKRWVDARLKLSPPKDANRVGDTHTFTAHLEFDYGNGAGFVDAPANETISMTKTAGPGTLDSASCKTNADGECSIDMESAGTGLAKVEANWNGVIATAEGNASADAKSNEALKRWVDVRLNLTPPTAVNRIGEKHVFTAHLEFDKGDGSGFANASGEKIIFSKTGGVGTLAGTECTTAGNGTCTIELNSAVTGSTNVEAAWNGDIVTAEGTVTTSEKDTAAKTWVDALITISPPKDTNEAGTNHVFTVSVKQEIGGVQSPANNVLVDTNILSGPGGYEGSDECTTNASGTCTVTIKSNDVGLTTVEAVATITVNGKSITIKTDGAAGTGSAPAIKRWVKARLSLTPPQDANQVGDDHTFKAHLEFDLGNGAGFVDAPAGEQITFTEAGPGTLGSVDCITNADGECTVVLTSSTPGLSEVKATWNGSITTAEGTAAMTAKTDDAVKRWVDARLSLTPPKDANQVNDPHTFTAHLEFNYGNGAGFVDAPNGETIDISKVSGPGSLPASCVTDGGDGDCDVVLTSSDVGLTTVEADWNGTIATAEGNAGADASSDEALKRWVDARLSITPPKDTNQVDDNHKFTAHLEFDYGDGAGFVDAPNGETIDFSKVGGPGTLGASCDTDGGDGDCDVNLTSSVTGLTTVKADWNGTIATAEGNASADASSDEALKRWVDARLALTPPQDVNRVGDTHTFTADLDFDMGDGAGFVNAPAGETISFTEVGPGTLAATSCITGATGQCTVDLDSPTDTGLSTVTADWTGSITTAEGTASANVDAVQALKRWVDVALDLTPPTAVNRIGDDHVFTAHLRFDKGDGAGFVNAAGETIDFTETGVGSLVGTSCTTAANGTCTITLQSSDSGTTNVKATWSGSVVVAEGSVATTATDDAEKIWVDALILINPPQDTNEVGDDHVFTITLKQETNGVAAPAAGVNVDASIVSGPGAFVGPDSCTTNVSGECTVTIRSDDTGLTTVHAEATVTVNGKSITVKTDGVGKNAPAAVKRWVSARLTVTPPEATNRVGDPHVFTAALELDLGDGSGFVDAPAGETITWTKQSGPGALVDDTCITDADGTCSVELNSDDAGITELEAAWTGAATTAEGSATMTRTDTGTKLWIDPAIEIVKSGEAIAHEGDTVTYTFDVTNTGTVDLVDVTVVDDVMGDIGTIGDLAVGETKSLSKDFVVPENTDQVDNIATACGFDPLQLEVCDDDPHSMIVIHPDIEIVKTASPDVGGPRDVTYTYVVTNTGDTDLFDVVVTDDILGGIGTIDELKAGESATLTRTESVDADTPRVNIGTACGSDVLDLEVCDDDDATITIVLPSPPEPRRPQLPATGFGALLWTAMATTLIALGLALVDKRKRAAGGAL